MPRCEIPKGVMTSNTLRTSELASRYKLSQGPEQQIFWEVSRSLSCVPSMEAGVFRGNPMTLKSQRLRS